MTHKLTIFASVITLDLCSVKASYFILKKEATYWPLSAKVKGQTSCDFLVALYIFTPLNHKYFQVCETIGGHSEHQRKKGYRQGQ